MNAVPLTTDPTATADPATLTQLRRQYAGAYQAGADSVAKTTMPDDEVDSMLAWALADLDNDHLRPYEAQRTEARTSAAFWLGSVEAREALAR